MPPSEYLVIPAPERPLTRSGLTTGDRDLADSLSVVMNDLAADGWTYVRTDRVLRRRLFGAARDVDLMVFTRAEAVAETASPPRRNPSQPLPLPTRAPSAKAVSRPAIPDHLISPRRYGGAPDRQDSDSSAA